MESTESTRNKEKKREKMKQIDQTQGDEQLVNQNQQISKQSTGAKIFQGAYGGGQMQHEEYDLLNSDTKLGGHINYTNLMQHVAQTPCVGLKSDNEGLQEYRKLLQTPLGFENSMILTTSRFPPEATDEQMQSTLTIHQKASIAESYYNEFDEIYNTNVEPLTEKEKEIRMEELYKSNNNLFRLETNPRYTAGDNLGESSIDEQQQWLNLYSSNSNTQISNDGILTNDAVLEKSMDSTTVTPRNSLVISELICA